MIGIIDYGMGNLRSVQKALEKVGAETFITHKPEKLEDATKIVLPGVGAMQPAMERLNNLELVEPIKKKIAEKVPFLGICLGLQLLFETSTEGVDTKGLGIIKGRVERFKNLKVPQMGWNQLTNCQNGADLFQGIDDQSNVYFCHSYYVIPEDKNITTTLTHYGIDFTSSIQQDNVHAVQFHPEKSQSIGLKILENFVRI